LRERWEIWDRLALRTDLVLAERSTIDADRDDQMCAGSAAQSARRSASWLICALCRARWLVRRAFAPGIAGNTAPLPQAGWGERPGMGDVYLCGIRTGNVARRAG
jgi:hypothetical protein